MSRIAQIKQKNNVTVPLKWIFSFLFFGHITSDLSAGVQASSVSFGKTYITSKFITVELIGYKFIRGKFLADRFMGNRLEEEGRALFGKNLNDPIRYFLSMHSLNEQSFKKVFWATDTGHLPKIDTLKKKDSLTPEPTAFTTEVKGPSHLDSSNDQQEKEENALQFTGTGKVQEGTASWYSDKFNGRKTANGERFDQKKMTAAHNKLPFGTWVKVTNLRNKKVVFVRINDRLHYKNKRVIDLTRAAAAQLGMIQSGLARVRVEVVKKKDVPKN